MKGEQPDKYVLDELLEWTRDMGRTMRKVPMTNNGKNRHKQLGLSGQDLNDLGAVCIYLSEVGHPQFPKERMKALSHKCALLAVLKANGTSRTNGKMRRK